MAGGKLLVLDPASEAIEGTPGAQTVIIEYPDKATALAAYRSAEYQAVVGIRHGATDNGRAVIVDGFGWNPSLRLGRRGNRRRPDRAR